MPKHHNDPKIPLAKQRNHWHEPVFPLTYSGYTPPSVTAESAQTDADSGAAQPRSPSKPKTKEPRMALSKFLFGGGSSRSDQAHLYQKVWRSEDYRTRETSGTGLGLYVVAKLALKLKTEIKLKSRLNHGSTFSFSLPATKK